MARRFPVAVLALVLVTVPASVAFAQSMMAPVAISMDPTFGQILTDTNGKTLYTLATDGPDVSNCSDTCAAAWPPLLVDTSMMDMSDDTMTMMMSGPLGATMRPDGGLQATWNHMPLYTSRSDNPGEPRPRTTGFGDFLVIALTTRM